MKQITDVVIIGGGIIGCAVAYQLRKQGVDVVVVDKGEIGGEASSAATGLLAPIRPFLKPQNSYLSLQLASLALFPSLVPELESVSGIAIEFERTGTLRVVQARQETRLRAWMQDWQQRGFPIELLTGNELHRQEPALASHIATAIYNPDEPQLNAAQLMNAYARAVENLGTILLTHTEVTGILRRGKRITSISVPQGEIACEHLVIAAGAWSAICGNWLDLAIPVQPLRGQSLALFQPASPVQQIIFGERVYLAPKPDGSIFVGATRDNVGFDCSTTVEGITWLRDAVMRLAPGIDTGSIKRAWAGLRPQTPDTWPILGSAPGWENVFLACGHGGFGILLSAITGQVAAEAIITGQSPLLIQPFGLQRFATQSQQDTIHAA
ncbi:MAG: glycine oxidase ThiO [Ktedonobacteraceae bacterium]